MKTYVSLFAAWACLGGVASIAHGHGFGISQLGNSVVANSGDVLHADWFRNEITEVTPTDFTMTHGAFSKTASPSLPNVAFGPSDTFSFDIVGPLLYSDGFSVTPALAGVTLDAYHTESPSQATISGASSGTTPGFAIAATSSHHIQWLLSGATVPDGAYAVKYQIKGNDDGNALTPFEYEEVLVVMDTQGANWGIGPLGALIDAQQLLYQFAMAQVPVAANAAPEPTSLMLALCSLTSAHHWRRKRLLSAGN